MAGAVRVGRRGRGGLPGQLSRLGADLRAVEPGLARYGLREPDVAFFDLFASPVAGFEEQALAIIEHPLDYGVDPRLVRRAARLLQSYELLFWVCDIGVG